MNQITIGRNPQNTIVVDGSYNTVSGNHATIIEDGDYLAIQDHSTNGTYVNGQHIHNQSIEIRQGDRISLGKQFILSWQDISRFLINSHATQRYPEAPHTVRDVERQEPHVAVNMQEAVNDSPREPMPEKHLALAIISLLLGFEIIICLILSIIAIVNASQVESKWKNRDYAGARAASEKAKSLSWWSIVIGFAIVIIYVIAFMNL